MQFESAKIFHQTPPFELSSTSHIILNPARLSETKYANMAVSIGKRKRSHDDDGSTASSEDESAMKALFQKAFEAKFNPLPLVESQIESEDEDETDVMSGDESDVEEWDGLSDDEEIIQVINHDGTRDNNQIDQAHERRTFMVRASSD